MAYQFPSPEWTEHFITEINTSEAYAKAASAWEGDILLVIDGGAALYLDLWHGQCRKAEYLADPASRKAEFKIIASLEKWRRMLDGKLEPIQGLLTGQVKLEGNLAKVMKHVRAAQELVRCATRVPTAA